MKKICIKKQLLYKLYFIKKLSLNQISKILEISNCTIESRLKEYGFKLRDKWEAKELIDQSGKNNGSYIDGRCLRKYYCKCGNEINYKAWRYGKKSCINCYLKIVGYFNKGLKRSKEIRSKYSLAKGGTGTPYENYDYPIKFYELREQIRKRDNHGCQLCGCSQIKNGKQLDVHHIDYNKDNCKENNLISLCMNCHRKTNSNRKFWQEYFLNKSKGIN
jgi:hypothetical protein